MDLLTENEINLVIQQLIEYQKSLKTSIKNFVDNEVYYDDFLVDSAELETVTNILDKLRG